MRLSERIRGAALAHLDTGMSTPAIGDDLRSQSGHRGGRAQPTKRVIAASHALSCLTGRRCDDDRMPMDLRSPSQLLPVRSLKGWGILRRYSIPEPGGGLACALPVSPCMGAGIAHGFRISKRDRAAAVPLCGHCLHRPPARCAMRDLPLHPGRRLINYEAAGRTWLGWM